MRQETDIGHCSPSTKRLDDCNGRARSASQAWSKLMRRRINTKAVAFPGSRACACSEASAATARDSSSHTAGTKIPARHRSILAVTMSCGASMWGSVEILSKCGAVQLLLLGIITVFQVSYLFQKIIDLSARWQEATGDKAKLAKLATSTDMFWKQHCPRLTCPQKMLCCHVDVSVQRLFCRLMAQEHTLAICGPPCHGQVSNFQSKLSMSLSPTWVLRCRQELLPCTSSVKHRQSRPHKQA